MKDFVTHGKKLIEVCVLENLNGKEIRLFLRICDNKSRSSNTTGQATQYCKYYIHAISRLTCSNIFHVFSYFIAINVNYELDIIIYRFHSIVHGTNNKFLYDTDILVQPRLIFILILLLPRSIISRRKLYKKFTSIES